MIPIVYKSQILNKAPGKDLKITLYSTIGTTYTFDIVLHSRNIDTNDRFGKIELLDSSIVNKDGNDTFVIYLNTREPDTVTSVTLINI